MRINSAQSIALAKRLYRKYGSWKAVRAASAIEGFAQDAEERLDPKGESAGPKDDAHA